MTRQHEPGWVCPQCGLERKEDGHDPCLGKLPGIKYACCGHGGKGNGISGYLYFENGVVLRFVGIRLEYYDGLDRPRINLA